MSQENLNLTHAESLLFHKHFFPTAPIYSDPKTRGQKYLVTQLICSTITQSDTAENC